LKKIGLLNKYEKMKKTTLALRSGVKRFYLLLLCVHICFQKNFRVAHSEAMGAGYYCPDK